jgi:hypothetical protein
LLNFLFGDSASHFSHPFAVFITGIGLTLCIPFYCHFYKCPVRERGKQFVQFSISTWKSFSFFFFTAVRVIQSLK